MEPPKHTNKKSLKTEAKGGSFHASTLHGVRNSSIILMTAEPEATRY